jgi:hypothetical protein
MPVDIEVIDSLPSHTLAFDGSSRFWSAAAGPFALVSRFPNNFYTTTFTLLEAHANTRCEDNYQNEPWSTSPRTLQTAVDLRSKKFFTLCSFCIIRDRCTRGELATEIVDIVSIKECLEHRPQS